MVARTQVIPAACARGVGRIWDPRVWGTIVGAVGATVFVMDNRGTLADPWPLVSVIGWALALAAYLGFVFIVPRTFGETRMVGPKSGLVYLGSVAGMLLLIRLGSIVLENAGKTELRTALIVVAVGLHFLPFAAAFYTRMFTLLGALMAVLGAFGLGLGWFWDARAAAALAVTSGIVMLIVIAGDAARGTRHPAEAG